MKLIISLGLIMSFLLLFGSFITRRLQLNNTKHAYVYGFLAYIMQFFIVTIPMAFLHVSWDVFYYTHLGLLLIFIACALFELVYLLKRFNKQIFLDKVWAYIRSSYGVLAILIFAVTMYVLADIGTTIRLDFMRYKLPIIDDWIYLARAAKTIGADAIAPVYTSLVDGRPTTDYPSLIVYWEFFWSFLQSITSLHLLTVVHTVIPLLIYPFYFFAIDEAIALWTSNEKKYQLVYSLFLYFFINIAHNSELLKFFFEPWFGNVFTTIAFIPLLAIFLHHAIENKKMFYLSFLYPIIATSFSSVTIIYVALLFPLYIMLWKNNQQLFTKGKASVAVGAYILGWLLFLVTSVIVGAITNEHGFALSDILMRPAAHYSEQSEYFDIIPWYIPMLTVGAALFFIRPKTKNAKLIYGYVFGLVFLGGFHLTSSIFFNIFSFSFRRFLESLSLYLMLYTIALFVEIYDVKKKTGILAIIIISLLVIRSEDIFILQVRRHYSVDNIVNVEKTTKLGKDVLAYFEAHPDNEYLVCVFPNRMLGYAPGESIDLGAPLMSVSNVYLENNCPIIDEIAPDINTMIIPSRADERFILEERGFIHTESFQDEVMDLALYELKR